KSQLTSDDQDRLAGQLKQLEKTHESLDRQWTLLLEKKSLLKLTSPIDGQVVTWDMKNKLEERPVEKGQVVMSVADATGQWELELHVREDRMGDIARAWARARAAHEELAVRYILATAPGRSHYGRVKEI